MERIGLNVGGTVFETTRTTLIGRSDTFFRKLVADRVDAPHDVIFIDRDPTHFRHILNFLRGTASFPSSVFGLEELCNEADFYCMFELVDMARQHQMKVKCETVSHQLAILASRIG